MPDRQNLNMMGKRSSSKAGLPPGSLVHIGKESTGPFNVSVFEYHSTECKSSTHNSIEGLKFEEVGKSYWINVHGLHHVPEVEKVGQAFHLHPLLLEDVLHTYQRPKSELFEEHVFLTLRMLGFDPKSDVLHSEQVSLILTKNAVVSFQEKEGDLFDPIRTRLNTEGSSLRKNGADYLLYRLLDTVVDNYFHVTEHLSELSEKIEEKVIKRPDSAQLQEIREIRKKLLVVKRAVVPLREALATLYRDNPPQIKKSTHRYIHDVYDHVLRAIDQIETQREVLAGVMDLYHSGISNNMNQVMKVLTIIATLFIPTTFIAGVYGMNFSNMPELQWKYGYLVAWAMMAAVFIGMLVFFRKKKWL